MSEKKIEEIEQNVHDFSMHLEGPLVPKDEETSIISYTQDELPKPIYVRQKSLVDVDKIQAIATIAKESKLFGVNSAEIAVKIMKGMEYGLQEMESISAVDIINGKPALNAGAIKSLILQHFPNAIQNEGEIMSKKDPTLVAAYFIEAKRGNRTMTIVYSMKDAKLAKLLHKQNWEKYPGDMLHARCVSKLRRRLFPDIAKGSYTPEELE